MSYKNNLNHRGHDSASNAVNPPRLRNELPNETKLHRCEGMLGTSFALLDLWRARIEEEGKWSRTDIDQMMNLTDRAQLCDLSCYAEFKSLVEVLLESSKSNKNTAIQQNIFADQKHDYGMQLHDKKEDFNVDTLSVILVYPSHSNCTFIINLGRDWSWNRFLQESCRRAGILHWDEMTLVRLETSGWNVKLTQAQSDIGVISSLSEDNMNNNVFELRKLVGANVGGKYRLSVLADEDHNPSIKDKVDQLSQLYEGFREIRGDGNCYYRAVVYGIMELIINSPRRHLHLRSWISLFKSIVFNREERLCMEYERKHRQLLKSLSQAADGTKWPTAACFEADILDESTELDEAFIRAAKYAVTSYVLANLETSFNGLSLETAFQAFDESQRSVESHCKTDIIAMGECAEGAHVYLGILPYLLGAHCEIIMLYSDPSVGLAIQQCDGLIPTGVIGEISLLFRPGHYDLLYRNKKAATSRVPISRTSSSTLLRSASEKSAFGSSLNHGVDNALIKDQLVDYKDNDTQPINRSLIEDEHKSLLNNTSNPVKTVLKQHELEQLNGMFHADNFRDIYYLLVDGLELPSSTVLDVMIVYRITSLNSLIKAVWALSSNCPFRPADFISIKKSSWMDINEMKKLVTTCKSIGITSSDIVFAIAIDEATEVNDVIDSIEGKCGRKMSEERFGEITTCITKNQRYKKNWLDKDELLEVVKHMGRVQILQLLKEFRPISEKHQSLSTRELREMLYTLII